MKEGEREDEEKKEKEGRKKNAHSISRIFPGDKILYHEIES